MSQPLTNGCTYLYPARHNCRSVLDVQGWNVVTDATYSAVLRPGHTTEKSVEGLTSDSLDEWIGAHGVPGDRFTYCCVSVDGTVLVRGSGVVDDQGDAAYKLRS